MRSASRGPASRGRSPSRRPAIRTPQRSTTPPRWMPSRRLTTSRGSRSSWRRSRGRCSRGGGRVTPISPPGSPAAGRPRLGRTSRRSCPAACSRSPTRRPRTAGCGPRWTKARRCPGRRACASSAPSCASSRRARLPRAERDVGWPDGCRRSQVSGDGRLGHLVFRAYGRYHRDARLILVTSLVTGAAVSLAWIDFNLYLAALGLETQTIGLVATIGSLAAALVAFPASAASDRFGRRTAFGVGIGAGLLALVALLTSEALPVIILAGVFWSSGNQIFQVVISPYLTEHSEPEHRNELFAMQFAIQQITNIAAAVLGGVVATWIASSMGLDPDGPGTYRIILVIMAGLLVLGLSPSCGSPTTGRRGPRRGGCGGSASPRRSRRTRGGPAGSSGSRSVTAGGSRSSSCPGS